MTQGRDSNVSAYAQLSFSDSGQAARHFGRGAAWMVVLRWTVRLIGVVSTIILARLLEPQDFGVMAIAMLVVAFIEVLAQSGQQLALVRHADDTRDLYDAAWTLSVIQGVLLALVVFAAAPLAGQLFDEPRASEVVMLLALRPLLLGFANIGVVAFQKELNFRRDFQFRVLGKCLAFVATVMLAVLLRSYWAMAIGLLVGALAEVVLSYLVHAFRPRVSFRRMRELLSFSLHILAQGISQFGNRRTDELVLASLGGTASVGHYAVASNLATAPTEELVVPMVRALHPVYARLADRADMLRETYLLVFGLVAAISLPAAAGIALVAADLVPVLLGEKWSSAIGIVQWLALAAGLALIANTSATLLNAVGDERRVTWLSWLRLAVLVPALVAAGLAAGAQEIAATRCLVALALLPVFIAAAAGRTGCGIGDYLRAAWRPVLASLAMTAAVVALQRYWSAPHFAQLVGALAAGAVMYVAVLLGAWALCGRPHGPERFVLEAAGGKLRAWLARR